MKIKGLLHTLQEQRILSHALHSISESVCITDLEDHILYVNPAFERAYGYSPEELLGRPISIVQTPSNPPEVIREIFPATLRGGWHGELLNRKKDGSDFPVFLSTSIVCDESGKAVALMSSATDISVSKRAAKALQQSEERYRELFENAGDMLYTCDLNGKITSINKAGEQMTGYMRETALQMCIEEIVAPEQIAACRCMFKQNLKGETQDSVYQTEFLCKDGRRIPVEIHSRLIYESGLAIGVHGTVRDISDRKRLEDQFRQAQKMEAVGRLSGGVAHDFNNVLTIVSGYAQLLLDNPSLDSSAVEQATAIKKAARRGAGLTSQLLAFSRKQVLQPRILNMNSVVKNAGEMLSRLIGEDVTIETKFSPDIPPVKVDPTQIEQVLMNLAVNARDAMPNGGRLVLETSAVVLREDPLDFRIKAGNYVRLAVSDTGSGMTDEVKSRIFEPFFSTKRREQGTGLGLATVYGIVRQSGGSIHVYSEVGHGTTFKIYLPAIESPQSVAAEIPARSERLSGSETVLLVEDEDDVRNLLERFLTRLGYSVLIASGPGSAIELVNSHQGTIDLLLSDVIMPGMNGPDMARRLTALRPQLRLLYMSGYTDEAILHHGVLDSAVNFIGKPFTIEQLSTAIRRALDEPLYA